jgi:hypothetical protein
MNEKIVCGCDESKALLARALAAEAKLQLVHSHVRGIARRLDGVAAMVEESFPVTAPVIDAEFPEVGEDESKDARVVDWMAKKLPKSERP